MSLPTVRFNKQDQPEFFKVLQKRVNQHFKDNNISRNANLEMKLKTVFMICLYFIPLIVLISGTVSNFWVMMAMWVLMGFGMSGIGLAIMHDANHGSYSKNKSVNKALGYLLNFIGGYPANWKIQHNVLHHRYTNVHDMDEDIDKGVMRFSPNQDNKPIFRFQAFYAPFLYGLLSVNWLILKDFQQIIRYNKMNLLGTQGLTFGRAIIEIIINKIWYLALTLVLPMIMLDLHWGQILLGFFVMHFICGLILALVFQPAHVIEETDFYKPDESGSIENSWAIHQLRTTSNFANGSKWFSWYVGGLNYQIEHHLFPYICHVHYKDISKIVKQTAEEFDVPYYHHETFYHAVKSHFSLLHQLGTGAYDRKLNVAVSHGI